MGYSFALALAVLSYLTAVSGSPLERWSAFAKLRGKDHTHGSLSHESRLLRVVYTLVDILIHGILSHTLHVRLGLFILLH